MVKERSGTDKKIKRTLKAFSLLKEFYSTTKLLYRIIPLFIKTILF
jgi:hypothetical protein